jgi:hypothetical protein
VEIRSWNGFVCFNSQVALGYISSRPARIAATLRGSVPSTHSFLPILRVFQGDWLLLDGPRAFVFGVEIFFGGFLLGMTRQNSIRTNAAFKDVGVPRHTPRLIFNQSI